MGLIACSRMSDRMNRKGNHLLASLAAAPKLSINSYAASQSFMIVEGFSL
jgi:hypothetical protein